MGPMNISSLLSVGDSLSEAKITLDFFNFLLSQGCDASGAVRRN